MSVDRTLAEEQTKIIEQLFPILKEIPVKAFVIEMGSATEAKHWIETTATKLLKLGVYDLRLNPEVTSIEMAEEGFWIYLTLETKGSGSN
jgi:L-2-hydroxyglutarate oxidase LhgO